jgi:cytochrome c oxidase subunit IV
MSSKAYAIWRRNVLVWLALLLLLVLTFSIAHLPLGTGNLVAGLAIATIKAGLVVMIFMGLRSANGLIKLTAAAGVFWLIFLFALTLSDVLARLANK